MAQLGYSQAALQDIGRLTDFLLENDPLAAAEIVDLIEEALTVLKRHPLMGRPTEFDIREMVISRGKTGYIALYSFDVEQDAVLILAIRHQREAGYAGD